MPAPAFTSSFLAAAIALAAENAKSNAGGPFGAIVVRDDCRVAEGVNRVTAANDPTAHAEVNAIRAACAALNRFDLRGCVLYVSCEPCPMCLAAIYWARLDAVFYAATKDDAARAGFDDAFVYREIALPAGQRAIACQNHLRAEGQAPFDIWRANPDKLPY